MNSKCLECIFCKLPRSPIAFKPLKENLEKFENLLETFDFDQYKAKDLLICFSCNQLLNQIFDFKSKFVEKEDELLNYTDAENTVDLCKVLISKGLLDKNHDNDEDKRLQICRICYKTTADDEFTLIEYGLKLATFITTCIPEFDLFLIHKTFICGQCCNSLLSFYRFLLMCIQAVKSATSEMTASTDQLAIEGKSQSEVEDCRTAVPKANVVEIIDLETDEPPNKKPKVEVDCEIIDLGPIIEVPSDEEQSIRSPNNDIKIVDVQKILNPSDRIIISDFISVESSELETTNKMEADIYQRLGQSHHPLSPPNKPTKDIFEKPTKFSYECQMCPVQYNSFDEILTHIKSHLEEKIFKCWMCGKSLSPVHPITDRVETHFKRRHGMGLYKIIEETDESNILTQETTPKVANKIKTFECQICWLLIDNIFELQKHVSLHMKLKKFICFNCTFLCSDFQVMRNHLARKHGISTLYQSIQRGDRKTQSGKLTFADKIRELKEKETEPLSDKLPISCPTCLEKYNTIEDFLIHPCSKAGNKYCCLHCRCTLSTIDELHDCKGPPKNKKNNNCIIDELPNRNRDSIETKSYNCDFCQILFETSQELDDHNCNTNDAKAGKSTSETLSCGDCAGQFESYDEIIGHICYNPVLIEDDLKIEDKDSSTLTAVTDTSAKETAKPSSDVIDIDSDSDTEFVEPNFHQAARVVKEICPVDLREATQLISQGIPVVTPESLQYQPLLMPMLPLDSGIGQENMHMTNGFLGSRAHYINSGGRVYVTNSNAGDTPLLWHPTQNSTISNLAPIHALQKSVENIMHAVSLNSPRTLLKNNDESLVISDDGMSSVNDETKENTRSSKWPAEEKNNYICISDDDESQETNVDCSMFHEESTNNDTNAKIKRPPTSFFLYKEKLKPELDKQFPHLGPRAQMRIAAHSWKNLDITGKWPFMEEARLLRELFRREHPELGSSKIQRKKPVPPKKPAEMPVMPQISAVFTLEDDNNCTIVLD